MVRVRFSSGAHFALWTGTLGAGVYWYDRHYQASSLIRTCRTLYHDAAIIADYKWNFQPDKADRIDSLHTRVAQRILHVCQKNNGLYIKLGQAIALYSTVLPPQYNEIFKVLYDRAPNVPYHEIQQVFLREFGHSPEELFAIFEREPVASASVAQVHRAQMKPDPVTGEAPWVAVKIQKPAIAKQLEWDLSVIRFVVWGLEKAFDLPLLWSMEYTNQHLRQEVDFVNEAHNADQARALLAQDTHLARHLYIPKVYWELTRPTVLTAEWIDGMPMSEVVMSPPQRSFYTPAQIMDTIVSTFAQQIFVNGLVHCDPHPGNLLLRPHPQDPRTYQVVLIDHGLYIRESETFRTDYCQLWKSIYLMDRDTIGRICHRWGVGDSDMMASFTLLRPFTQQQRHRPLHLKATVSKEEIYAMQLSLKERVHQFLLNTELFPRELIFVGRNMNMVRALNKAMGAPVNRTNIMANYAAKGLGSNWGAWSYITPASRSTKFPLRSLVDWLIFVVKTRFSFYSFRLNLWVISVVFYFHQAWERVMQWAIHRPAKNFEQLMDESLLRTLEDQLGYKVDISFLDA
ncbi:hypothetical protein IWQ62_000062 [Dispira parvispora]|uniref:ABC1 atypical kinase-like domain-containing protein n=1 Tax=Dispira parvispora TaxID=1520584 RepID=A0A9W8AVK6_9FUNG|nr:hypothetical protein IWQ62_000062 [Dispira parvispora]